MILCSAKVQKSNSLLNITNITNSVHEEPLALNFLPRTQNTHTYTHTHIYIHIHIHIQNTHTHTHTYTHTHTHAHAHAHTHTHTHTHTRTYTHTNTRTHTQDMINNTALLLPGRMLKYYLKAMKKIISSAFSFHISQSCLKSASREPVEYTCK